jgi:Cys-rich repeat protein
MPIKKSASSAMNKLLDKATQNYSKKIAGSASLLYNKYLLYVSFVVAFINILLWLSNGDYFHVIIFFLVGYLTYQFSKNMIVILVISVVVSNIVKSGTTIVLEGMEDKTSDSAEGGKKADKKNKDTKDKEGLKLNKKLESYEGLEEEDAEMEGLEETPCTQDSDCKNGKTCDTNNFVCTDSK